MTWQSAKSVAQECLAKMNLPPSLKGARIQLTDYESNADLKFLKGADEWQLEFHRMVNGGIARELRKRGAKVEIIKISMADYFSWIAKHNLENSAANRAQYISWMTATEPKPTPIK